MYNGQHLYFKDLFSYKNVSEVQETAVLQIFRRTTNGKISDLNSIIIAKVILN